MFNYCCGGSTHYKIVLKKEGTTGLIPDSSQENTYFSKYTEKSIVAKLLREIPIYGSSTLGYQQLSYLPVIGLLTSSISYMYPKGI